MEVSGLMIYYYFVCKKKLWYYLNEIYMEQNSELVSIGNIIDETSYSTNKKNILIDNTINIDFIDNKAIIHEIKKSKSVKEAGIWQVKYYMYYLKQKGIFDISAEIDYPLLHERKKICLNKEDIEILEEVKQDIIKIKNMDKPPQVDNQKICKKCAYYDLCFV